MSVSALNTRQLSTDWISTHSRRRMAVVAVGVVLASLGLTRLVLLYDLVVVGVLLAWIGIVAVVVQPRLGLYALVALVMLFEGSGEDPLMLPGVLLNNSLQSTLGASGGILIPLEMLLMLTSLVWLAHGLVRRRMGFRSGALGRPVLLLSVALLFGVVRGLLGGAIFNYAFWESRFLFQMVLCYVLAANTIRTRGHVRVLMTVILLCGGLGAIEGAWRRFALIDNGLLGQAQETWYSHDSVVMWGLVIMLVFAQQAFGSPRWQRVLGPVLLVITGFTMLASERRAGFIAVMVAFAALSMVLFVAKRKAFLLISLPAIIAAAIYLPVFWNNTGTAGQAARAVRSVSDPDPRDASSNLARDLEAINVRYTIASDPVLGIGFGQPFPQIVPIPDISAFPFWNYEAHHAILWIWMKIGAIGFTLFFVVMCHGLARSASLARKLREPDARVFAILTLSCVILSLVFSYVDLGLTSGRVPIMLGTTLGALSVLDHIYT